MRTRGLTSGRASSRVTLIARHCDCGSREASDRARRRLVRISNRDGVAESRRAVDDIEDARGRALRETPTRITRVAYDLDR
jgi:hypothetical protein